jgi:hypothetical protein
MVSISSAPAAQVGSPLVSRAAGRAGRLTLIVALAGVALGELFLNRIVAHLLPRDPFARGWRLFLHVRLFAYELCAVLATMMLARALVTVARSRRYHFGARISLAFVGVPLVLLSAYGTLVDLADVGGNWFALARASSIFVVLLLVLQVLRSEAPSGVRLGAVALFLPLALDFAAPLLPQLLPDVELPSPLMLQAIAEIAAAATACALVLLWANRAHGVRFGIACTGVVVGAAAALIRLDWETSARVAAYGFGLTLPMSPWALFLFLVAIGAFVFTTMTLLSSSLPDSLRGWGLFFVALGGLDQKAPFQMALTAFGFFCIAESVADIELPRMSNEAFGDLVRRGAAAIGSPQATVTGRAGYERAQLHSPSTVNPRVEVSLTRKNGAIRELEVRVGETPPRDPPFTLAHRRSKKLGSPADAPAITTGDAGFDRTFATHDRRGLNAQLLDDDMRARLTALSLGWLGVWPQRGVHYRATALAGGEDALPLLLQLLSDLYTRAQ